MSFENVYRSETGAAEIEKIADFIGSLVIKNKYEANRKETSESIANYYAYYGAYTKTDQFSDYDKDDRRKYKEYVNVYLSSDKSKPYMYNELVLNMLTESSFKDLEDNKDKELYKDYLTALRISRIYLYEEKNEYYRQFMGVPNSNAEIVYLINIDKGEMGYSLIEDYSTPPDPYTQYYYYDEEDKLFYPLDFKLTTGSWAPALAIHDKLYTINLVKAHDINNKDYPLTYSYYILQGHIEEVIEKYPNYNYLKFIGESYTPFKLRMMGNYDIIKYKKNILSDTELTYFFKAYNKAKTQVLLDYIDGFDSKQPLYNILMIENLLYYTIINYSNSYIEKYSLGIYTEKNLDDILNSHGYSSLTKISDVKLKERVVKNLNDLIANKGNNYVLNLILEKILEDPNVQLKRYYLEKKYRTDEDASISIDTSKGLENSIDLVFREVSAIDVNTKTSEDIIHDYDIFVNEDKLWGGWSSDDTNELKSSKKEVLKKELLELNFNSILTRYITLTRTVDILESQRQIRDLLYLMLKFFDQNDSPEFFEIKTFFKSDIAVPPAALFGAICWLQQMKNYSNPDIIIKDNCVINSTAVFRQLGRFALEKTSFENKVIVDGRVVTQYDISPEIATWKVVDFIKENEEDFKDFFVGVDGERIETVRVKDIITLDKIPADGYKHLDVDDEDLSDYMTIYRFYSNGQQLGEFTNNTTFEELVDDYKNQYPNLLKRITWKLRNSYDFREFQAWTYILNQSRTNNSIYFIFRNCTTFTEYLSSLEADKLKVYILDELGKNPTNVEITKLQNEIIDVFKRWVNDSFSKLVYEAENSDTSGSSSDYINDMIILFNEFLSVFSELYSIDYRYTFGDKSYEGLDIQLFYNPVNVWQTYKPIDKIELREYIKSSMNIDLDGDKLELLYSHFSNAYNVFYDNVNNDIKIENSTIQYIDDQFKYDPILTQCACKILDLFEMKHHLFINVKSSITDSISLSDGKLTIKTSTGETKNYA